jgi:membrane protein implicated in regulation of membrane protease activity
MTILWWHWLALGLLLTLGELATPGGFYILFFGLGAVATGFLVLAGVTDTSVQVFLFIVLSITALMVFRGRMLRMFQHDPQAPEVDAVVGEIATASATLEPGGIGKVELRGSSWSARNASPVALAPGARCRVMAVDGLLLLVGPEGGRS